MLEKSGQEVSSAYVDILRLENQLCFALYAATRTITKTYREKLTPLGLTYPQYLVLIVLWEEEGQTITAIGRRLMLDSGTLTPLIKRLENAGLVERRRGIEDEREVQVYLTDAGRGIKGSVLEARCFVACRLGMSEPEILALRADLMDMIARLDAAAEPMMAAAGEAVEPD
ncbi:MAG: MarR family transcriptional regulator [Alphaproteobacteria bacterium]|nr:MarR family transcriptional regulator [Alphaproteobacteria bacterium]